MDVQRVPGAAGRVTVTPSGQIDLATAPALADALRQARSGDASEVVVDLTRVDFMDSAGVRVLIDAARETDRGGGRLYLSGAHGWVARVLEITGVADFLAKLPDAGADPARPPEASD